jgi:hypothetical protein
MFGMCAFFLCVCLFCQRQFASIIHQEQAGSHYNEDDAEAAQLLSQSTEAIVSKGVEMAGVTKVEGTAS